MGFRNCILRVLKHFLRTFFSQNHLKWHCERKNSTGFVKTAFYFSGELLSKTIFEVVDLIFFLVLARFFKHVLLLLYSPCPDALFAEFFSQKHNIWHCERKKWAGFVRTAFYFSGELLSKTISKVVDLFFFLVLAKFFKHGLPKVYSTCPEEIFAEFYSQNHIKWHGERKNSAGFVRTAFYFPEELSSKTILVYYSLPDFSRMGCQNCSLRVLKHFLRTFFSQNHTNWPCERKNSAGFVKTAFYFSEELSSKTFLVYYSLADSASMGCKNCILRVQMKFLRNFIHRIILVGTLSEKMQLVLSKLLSIFPGTYEQNNSRSHRFGFFLVLARFFKHGLPKLYSTCPEALFAEFFSQNLIKWHCERKNSAGFVRTAFYFPVELSSKTILVYISLPDFSRMGFRNCILRVLKHFLRTFFSQNHTNWPCERKTAFYFSGDLLSKTIFEVVDLIFFLVLARFFKHVLLLLYSPCPDALFAEFFSQKHNIWHCERKKWAGFVRTAFYFSGELLSKTISKVVDLVFL